MFIAGIFIVSAFFVFAFFSLLLLAPGLLLYNAGIKSIFKNGPIFNDDNIKIIDATPRYENNFANKGKSIFKSAVKKLRNFLNKYAD